MKLRWPWRKKDEDPILERLMEGLHNGQVTDDWIDPELTQWIADEMTARVLGERGMGDVAEPEPIIPQKLPVLVHVFRGFHTHRQLKRASMDLLIADGTDFERWAPFKRKILKWAPDYDLVQLQEEYDLARATVRSMENWKEAQTLKDVAPNIRFSSAGDDLVIAQDLALDGLIRPVDDAFWDTWWPPNGWGWGCRSTVIPERDEVNGDLASIEPTEPMFANNVGKYGVKFPDEHPYSVTLKRYWRLKKARQPSCGPVSLAHDA